MSQFKAITTVYSYYLPEIRQLITDLTRDYPHDVFLRSISPGLDDFHQPIIEKLIAAHEHDVPQLVHFTNRYPTAGSEEGIREHLTMLQSSGVKQIYVWKGDYEGYREVAKTRNITAVEVEYGRDPGTLEPSYWYISNPSARNGMIVPREHIIEVAEAGHKIFYDLSYMGSTGPAEFDVSHPNVDAVAISFSKSYGLFYYRIGFLLRREPIPTLYANKWFKNVYGLLIAERILDTIDLSELAQKYKSIQSDIVEQINQSLHLGLSGSDAFLLCHLSEAVAAQLSSDQQELISKFKRGDWFRFCLTPYFEEYEKAKGTVADK